VIFVGFRTDPQSTIKKIKNLVALDGSSR